MDRCTFCLANNIELYSSNSKPVCSVDCARLFSLGFSVGGQFASQYRKHPDWFTCGVSGKDKELLNKLYSSPIYCRDCLPPLPPKIKIKAMLTYMDQDKLQQICDYMSTGPPIGDDYDPNKPCSYIELLYKFD